jgi:rubrerythrin
MTDSPMSPPVGASVWERDLYDHLATHVENESALLKEYSAAAETTDSKAFAYLVKLLIEDERRHHGTFAALASSLKTEAELSGQEPEIPYLDLDRADRAQVRELSERLLERERQDAAELKRLHGELRSVKDTTLWDLLVSNMRADTDRHIAILDFVLRHTPKPEK